MIFDSIDNKDSYKHFPLLFQALDFLSNLPENTLPSTGTILIEDQLFFNPVTLVSKPESECIFEAHRKYIDLHYIVEGVERIGTADITALTETVPYSEEKDIGFFAGTADGYYNLKPGQFMLCFPHDAHKVAIMSDRPAPIKKIVFKIKAQ
ncbi:MAG TPA: YhcH/YjgK/YiaL family protein [Candidatus Mediterraneibacter merdavium]|nr:YhcH/YjgK/YiaL family protein [Candidatus Mediterraneibacter merdavium]